MLLQLASAAKWLGNGGMRVFMASRGLHEMRPPQSVFQFLVIVRTHHRCSFIEYGDDPASSARMLFHGFMDGIWGAVMPSFATAGVVHRECSLMTVYDTNFEDAIAWQRGAIVIDNMRDSSLNLLIGTHGYIGTHLRIVTRRDTFVRSNSYVARVGRHYIRLMFTDVMFETDDGFVFNIRVSFDLGEPLVIDVIDRPAVPAGPRYCELLG